MTTNSEWTIPPVASAKSLDAIARAFRDNLRCDICGVEGGALAPLLVQCSKQASSKIVSLVSTEAEARVLYQDLVYHLSACGLGSEGDVGLFPGYDFSPYDELAVDRRVTMDRFALLFKLASGKGPRFVIMSTSTASTRVVPEAAFSASCESITVGDDVDRDDLVHLLARCGYHQSPVVEEPGTYAVRGGLVDFFSPYMNKPVRVDLFGFEVERIREFDPVTQRSGEPVSVVWVHPARTGVAPREPVLREIIAQRLRDICDVVDQPTRQTDDFIEDVLSGRLVVGSEGYWPAFHASLGTVFDYIPRDASFCVVNPTAVKLAWEGRIDGLNRDFEVRQQEAKPAFSPAALAVDSAEFGGLITSGRYLLVHPLSIEGGEPDSLETSTGALDLRSVDTESLGDRLRTRAGSSDAADVLVPLVAHLNAMEELGYRTTIVAHTSGQADRMLSMLEDREVRANRASLLEKETFPGLTVSVGELARGCLLPGDGRAWLSEEELFGHRVRRRRTAKRAGASLSDLKTLTPGDLIVHTEHGIGCYEGLVRQQVRGSEMDFLLIKYRGGDKLYLPVYRLSQVQKYKTSNSEGARDQRLDKLGGQTFAKTLSEAKRSAVDLAGKLLEIYARRSAAERSPIDRSEDLYRSFEAGFLFEETDDQLRAIDDIMADMDGTKPMDRLVCGDVGFGKTEVALRGTFRAVMSGVQVAVLVPTTVLAQQHFQTFKARFESYPVNVAMLSRFRTAKQNREALVGIKDGRIDIVIGTHRLLSKDIHFKRLGLLIVDEEHRFGVAHKERIRALRASVDTLVMTATPIPRTLQMSMTGLRDLSLIATAPKERRPVRTVICHDDTKLLKEAIERELARDGQVFFVHNRVRDIDRVAQRVKKMVPSARIVVGHGQMKEHELERVMHDFVSGRFDVLVCTTIIESGLDIPRANTMIIDRADTFGMAQLYQLRGRVGRGRQQAFAYLIIPPASMLSEEAQRRVETLARYSDLGSGFSVATMDMELRGAGNLLGPEQSGDVNAVGYEMFIDLLSQATAQLRGEEMVAEIEPELTLERPGFLDEDYLPDVGQRLHYYKKFASAHDEEEVQVVAADLIDRYGPLPQEAEELVKGMVAKALCRALVIRGVEATARSMTIHLGHDTKVNPDRVVELMREEHGRLRLTQDLKIKRRFNDSEHGGVDGVIHFLHRLGACDNNPSIS